jgi:hypothetical protein
MKPSFFFGNVARFTVGAVVTLGIARIVGFAFLEE